MPVRAPPPRARGPRPRPPRETAAPPKPFPATPDAVLSGADGAGLLLPDLAISPDLPTRKRPSRPQQTPLLSLWSRSCVGGGACRRRRAAGGDGGADQKFDERAIKLGARVVDVSAARYVLCR